MAGKLKKKITVGTICNYAIITLITFCCLYPFLNVIAYSLSGYNAVLSGRVTFYPIDFTLDAYKQILGRSQIWMSMKSTVIVTVLGTFLSLFLTVCAAYALSRDYLPGRKFFTGLILFTMYFSGGMIPTFLVVKQLGLYDTLAALFIPQSVNVFNFIVMRTFFRELPKELEEAARIDGASDIQTLARIILPLSLPIIATIGLFYAVGYWNSYFAPLIFLSNEKLQPIQLYLRSILITSEVQASGMGLDAILMNEQMKYAVIVIACFPIMVLYPFIQKYFEKGVLIGAVK